MAAPAEAEAEGICGDRRVRVYKPKTALLRAVMFENVLSWFAELARRPACAGIDHKIYYDLPAHYIFYSKLDL